MCLTVVPEALCIQLMRFSVTGKKQQHHIQYQEELTLDISLKDEAGKALYSLVGVVVHEGNSVKAGHNVAYVKKSGQWYRTDDIMITKVSSFEATHQQAYLLFYQKAQKLPCLSEQSKRSRLSLKKGLRSLDTGGKQQNRQEEKQKNSANALKRESDFAQPKNLSNCSILESEVVPTSDHSNTKAQKLPCPSEPSKPSRLSLKKGLRSIHTGDNQRNIQEEKQRNSANDLKRKSAFAQPKNLSKSSQLESEVIPTSGHSNTKGKAFSAGDDDITKKDDTLTHGQTIRVKRPASIHTVPPNYYVNDNQCPLPTKPRVVRSSKSVCVSYKKISEINKQKAEMIAQKGVKARKHPRLAGWTTDDMLCLLPHQSDTGSWLSNFVVNHFMLLLEEHAAKVGNKVKTLNCDVLNNMAKPCKKTFLKNGYNTLYANLFDSDVILSLFNKD